MRLGLGNPRISVNLVPKQISQLSYRLILVLEIEGQCINKLEKLHALGLA